MRGMSPRKQAISDIADRVISNGVDYAGESMTEIYGKNVFSERLMRARLPKSVFNKLQNTIRNGEPLDPTLADTVANAMKDWALEQGATHYTHWFQPMTGLTAEKHDSFITPTADGHIISEFSGKDPHQRRARCLLRFLPEAFAPLLRPVATRHGIPPHPAFISENVNGRTLCIPTAFCSYTGEALDRKTPPAALHRSRLQASASHPSYFLATPPPRA